jgi:hypothetical protein
MVLLAATAAIVAAAAPPRVLPVRPEPTRAPVLGNLQIRPTGAGVRLPLMLDDYCVYSLSVEGTGDIDLSIEWDRDDVALGMRLFAPGTQQVIAEADGYRKVELSARAGLRVVDPNGPTGDWMLEVRQVAGPPLSAVMDVSVTATGTTTEVQGPAKPDLDRPAERVRGGFVMRRVRFADDSSRPVKIWRPQVVGTLSGKWPGSGAGKIVNVTERQEHLRRQIAAMEAEKKMLHDWQLQWDKAAAAYFLASVSREDLEDLHERLNEVVDQLQQVPHDNADDLIDQARDAAEQAREQFRKALEALQAAMENETESVQHITN